MKKLFDAISIGNLDLKNRIVRSATFERGLADNEGRISDEFVEAYAALAGGGAAMIISGLMVVDENGRIYPHMVKAYGVDFVSGLGRLARVVHNNGSKLMVQLNHGGVKALPTEKDSRVMGPSPITFIPDNSAQGMSKDDIKEVAGAFALAAARCQEAGADGVQIHGAHGYLLSEFLSPFFNKRQDEYGGDIKGRSRFILEVLAAIRQEVGADYPVWVKINCQDFAGDQSFTFDECIQVCRALAAEGLSAVELSGGVGSMQGNRPSRFVGSEKDEGLYAREALQLADALDIPVLSVGGFRTPKVMEEWLNKGNIQALSLSRPLIREPALVRRWQSGDTGKATCISCNKCFEVTKYGCWLDQQQAAKMRAKK